MTDGQKPLHPRPRFTRERWIDLNGPWRFAYDDGNVGLDERWQDKPEKFDRTITVPFRPESKMSGINDNGFHPYPVVPPNLHRAPARQAAGCCCISAPSTTRRRSGSTAISSPRTRAATRRSRPTSPRA